METHLITRMIWLTTDAQPTLISMMLSSGQQVSMRILTMSAEEEPLHQEIRMHTLNSSNKTQIGSKTNNLFKDRINIHLLVKSKRITTISIVARLLLGPAVMTRPSIRLVIMPAMVRLSIKVLTQIKNQSSTRRT